MGSTCSCTVASTASGESQSGAEAGDDGETGSPVDAAVQLALDASAEIAGSEAAEAARLKLQLSTEEWMLWEQRKEDLLEERQRIREQLKQRFEEFCERNGVGPLALKPQPPLVAKVGSTLDPARRQKRQRLA